MATMIMCCDFTLRCCPLGKHFTAISSLPLTVMPVLKCNQQFFDKISLIMPLYFLWFFDLFSFLKKLALFCKYAYMFYITLKRSKC